MSNIIDSIQLSGTVYQIQGSGGGVPESVFTAYTASTDSRIGEDEEVTAAALNALDEKIDSISGGGNPTVEVTQAEYDAMVSAGTVSADTYYIITDAQAGDLTNYYTKTETNTLLDGKADTATTYTKTEVDNAITAATSTKQDTLTAGRGIDINASNVVSFNLPISAGTRSNSIVEGNQTIANGYSSHAEGLNTRANNPSEHASGRYNNSVSASTTFGDSGNTLFSVGNGTADNARHNAFEIRQNGDIYLTLDGQDVKLQDQLGGGGTVDQTIISGSTNAVAGGAVYDKFDEVEQVTAAALNNINDRLSEDEEVTAAGLNAVNDKFGGLSLVKLTQAEYDAIATKDASTLYIIVN